MVGSPHKLFDSETKPNYNWWHFDEVQSFLYQTYESHYCHHNIPVIGKKDENN